MARNVGTVVAVNAPKFSNELFAFYIAENKAPDSYVGRLNATDCDVGCNAEKFSNCGFIKTTPYFDMG